MLPLVTLVLPLPLIIRVPCIDGVQIKAKLHSFQLKILTIMLLTLNMEIKFIKILIPLS